MGKIILNVFIAKEEWSSWRFDAIISELSSYSQWTIHHSADTGAWIGAIPQTQNNTVLNSQDLKDGLFLHYHIIPPILPKLCNGWRESYSLGHLLSCKKGVLIIQQHDDLKNYFIKLLVASLLPGEVRYEPIVHTSPHCSARTLDKDKPPSSDGISPDTRYKLRGNLMVRGLCAPQNYCIINVCMTDLDCKTNKKKDISSVFR